MPRRSTLALFFIALATFACKKEDDTAPSTSTPAATCGIAGARLQSTFGSESFCANASLFGDLAVDVLTVNGISQSGITLTLELDSLEPGSYDMGTDVNHVLYTSGLAMGYESVDGDPATLVIDSHDATANRIRGSITGPLFEPLGGSSHVINATFDITYLE